MKLKHVAQVKLNTIDADFWIVRKGTLKKVGLPVEEYRKEYIGIKVTNTDILNPRYLLYYMGYLYRFGFWKQWYYGSTNLKHIRVTDVKDIKIGE